MLLTDRFARFLRCDLLALVNIITIIVLSHVDKISFTHFTLTEYRQRLIVLRYREHVKSVSVSSVSELSLSITTNPYLRCQQSRHNV